LREYFSGREADLCEHCRGRLGKNVLRVLDCKNPRCREVAAAAPRTESHLCAGCRAHFDAVLSFLQDLGIGFEIDPLLVRGLDYYTGTVFEVRSPRLGAQDAVAAGGRYDNLIAELGGPSLGAVGFSIGMERLLICAEGGEIASLPPAGRLVYALSLGAEAFRKNFILLRSLRQGGIRGEMDFQGRSLKAQMREANRLRADQVVIRGDEELKAGKVKIKDMKSGEEALVDEGEVVGTCNLKSEI
jgi:histidyl-tRNA synthetase